MGGGPGQPGYGVGPAGPPGPQYGRPAQPYGPPGQAEQGGYPNHPGYPGQPPQAGPPPAGHPGQPGSAQPKPRSSRKVLPLIAGLAVAAVVLLLVVVGGAFGGNPRDTADEFMAAIKAKDVDKAHSLLCKDGQEKETKEELRTDFDLDDRTVTGYTLGTESTREREGKDETLIPVTISYDSGSDVRLDLGVWNEGGQKICSLNPPAG
jgi:hypothetical protein